MFRTFLEYFQAVFYQWKGLFTFLPFAIDVAMPVMWVGWEAWAQRNLPTDRRRKFFKYAALFGFLLANFFAFSDENNLKVRAIIDLNTANARLINKGQIPVSFRHLNTEQKKRISDAFSGYPLPTSIVIAAHTDDDSINLAKEIGEIIKEKNVNVIYMSGYLTDPSNTGFFVEIKHPKAPTPDGFVCLSVIDKTGIMYKTFAQGDDPSLQNVECGLFVGPPDLF